MLHHTGERLDEEIRRRTSTFPDRGSVIRLFGAVLPGSTTEEPRAVAAGA